MTGSSSPWLHHCKCIVTLQQIIVFLVNIFKNSFLTIFKVLQFPEKLISWNLQYFHQNMLVLFYYNVSYLHVILQKQPKNCNAKIFRNSCRGLFFFYFAFLKICEQSARSKITMYSFQNTSRQLWDHTFAIPQVFSHFHQQFFSS